MILLKNLLLLFVLFFFLIFNSKLGIVMGLNRRYVFKVSASQVLKMGIFFYYCH